MRGCIVGWAHTPFGKAGARTVEDLIVEAASGALADAGLAPDDVDEIFLGHFNAGFVAQDFTSSLVLEASPALRFKPATRVENACATGSAAVRQGLRAIETGDARFALVVGVEKMTERSGAEIGDLLIKASYVAEEGDEPGGFVGLFGRIAAAYFQRYGDQSKALAAIAAKNHKHGLDNPLAHVRKDLGFDFCNQVSDKNPYVAGPLRRTDCSLVSDGAAALVLANRANAKRMEKVVAFRANVQINDFLPMAKRDILFFEGCAEAWRRAREDAGITLEDLDVVETHDCFTIAELLEYEAMGLAEPGKGAELALSGATAKGGRLPINPSGGLKAKGHPIGATGVSMHVLAARQARGDADAMQVEGATLAGVYNMGGACVANYVSVLEASK